MDLVYLVHAEEKLHHSNHYIGFCSRGLESRMAFHKAGRGSRFLKALNQAEIYWQVVRIWEGDRTFERKLKKRKKARELCPVCKGEGRRILNRNERNTNLLNQLQKRGVIQKWVVKSTGKGSLEWELTTIRGVITYGTKEMEAFLAGAFLVKGGE